MDGHELAGHLLAERPNLKVIFTSGPSVGALREKEFVDDDDFIIIIEKPYQTIKATQIIRQLLDTAPAREHSPGPARPTAP